jgi:hypothetical protein
LGNADGNPARLPGGFFGFSLGSGKPNNPQGEPAGFVALIKCVAAESVAPNWRHRPFRADHSANQADII